VIGKFLQKAIQEDAWPCIRWTTDESIAARRVTNELQFWVGASVHGHPVQKLRIENISDFSLSPSKGVYFVAAFIAEKKGSPAEVRLYKYPVNQPLCHKSFYADAAEFTWSPNGKHLLVSVTTHVDRTGRSYYGQSGLYYLSEKTDCIVDTTSKKDGPVHSCCWRPDGLHFSVVYGFMPPKISAFNLKCDLAFEYGISHKSRVRYSPDGRILLIAGLGGGLKGDLEFWNPTDLKKYGAAEASSSAVYCEWAPDSLHVMTAILSPRMRVDNSFHLWDYQGNLLYKQEFSELTHIAFRPMLPKLFPTPQLKYAPKPSAAATTQSKSAGAYRHPNYRGGEPSIVREALKPATESKPKKYQPPSDEVSTIPGYTPAPKKNAGGKKKPAGNPQPQQRKPR
jgi:translation initiation factor 2A